jgi:hypothetical protein
MIHEGSNEKGSNVTYNSKQEFNGGTARFGKPYRKEPLENITLT